MKHPWLTTWLVTTVAVATGTALAEPPSGAELRHHGERTSRLRRMRFVAETERKGSEQEKILARIDKLLEKENARHERAIKRFAAPQGASGGKP